MSLRVLVMPSHPKVYLYWSNPPSTTEGRRFPVTGAKILIFRDTHLLGIPSHLLGMKIPTY
jgi:hypothetical protein